jgi:hypothetical protein
MSKYSLLTLHKLHTQLKIFWFQLFRSADKNDKDDALEHLVLPPTPSPTNSKVHFVLGHSH